MQIKVISSTSKGGGVAEDMRHLIPLLRAFGIDIEWYVIESDDAMFFMETKRWHNIIQGLIKGDITKEGKRSYFRTIKKTSII